MANYELSIAENYVPNWTVKDAVRELFQNAIDQQTINPDNIMTFDAHNDVLEITTANASLETSSLLLGASTKQDSDTTIGQYGEGYKLALLVLTREGKQVVIENYGKKECWRPNLKYSNRFGTKLLAFDVKKVKSPDHANLRFIIIGLSEEEMQEIIESNLHMQMETTNIIETSMGTILLDDHHKGQVYVGGLHVCDHKYTHGYNFKPEYMKLDRDRKLISDFDLEWLASRMWAASGSDKIIALAETGAKDVAYLENQYLFSTPAKTIPDQALAEFKLKHGEKAHPVTSQAELTELISKSPDAKAVIVTSGFKHLIKSSQDYEEPEEVQEEDQNPIQRLLDWFDNVEELISEDQALEFRQIMEELKPE